AGVILRSADREHVRVGLADQLGALAQAAGDDHLAVLVERLADGVQRLLHGRIDEAAGVDHHGIGGIVIPGHVVAFDAQLGQDALGIDQRLGAAEADETDFRGRRGHAAYYGGQTPIVRNRRDRPLDRRRFPWASPSISPPAAPSASAPTWPSPRASPRSEERRAGADHSRRAGAWEQEAKG